MSATSSPPGVLIRFLDYEAWLAALARGLMTWARFSRLTCRYTVVVVGDRCPSSSWTWWRLVPASMRWVAKLCRNVCTLTGFVIRARFIASLKIDCIVDNYL